MRKQTGSGKESGSTEVAILIGYTRELRLVSSHLSPPHTRAVLTAEPCHCTALLTPESVILIPKLPSPWYLITRTRNLRFMRKGEKEAPGINYPLQHNTLPRVWRGREVAASKPHISGPLHLTQQSSWQQRHHRPDLAGASLSSATCAGCEGRLCPPQAQGRVSTSLTVSPNLC